MRKDFIDIQDFSSQELFSLLELIKVVKAAGKERALPDLLRKASLAMIFEEPSTRTRVSFEVAMSNLGGHALYLRPGEIHLGARETIADTARVLSRMVNGIEARLLRHTDILELAKYATVPVINGLTDLQHPTQVLCDAFTMLEHSGRLKGLNLAFIGDSTNVCNSLLVIATKLGINFLMASPKRYQPVPSLLRQAEENARKSGSRILIGEGVANAVQAADFIYTDLWWWVGQEAEIDDRMKAFMPQYQVNANLAKIAPAHAHFMHCLPASRGLEITDEIMDGAQSIVFDQAENRLHTEEALLIAFLRPYLKGSGGQREADFQTRIEQILSDLGNFPGKGGAYGTREV